MELIFNEYDVKIHRDNERFFLTYDAGHIIEEYKTIEITKDEALRAQENSKAAYLVIIHHQNVERFGEDYMNR